VLLFGLDSTACFYAKPSDFIWLAGSVILGVTFFAGFFWYLALADRLADNADR
jgi:hypothetical protein